jgi:NodT family efflux transporter outer membrane factor (OMF) lipoprotein
LIPLRRISLSTSLAPVGAVMGLLLLSACAAGTDYTPPKIELDAGWNALSDKWQNADIPGSDTLIASSGITVSENGTLPPGAWWEQFGDETLSALMQKALEGSNELKVVEARLAEAQADEYYVQTGFLPQVNADASISRSSLDAVDSSHPDTIRQAGLSSKWDIDLFGGTRRRSEAASANVAASAEDVAQARLNLLANIALNYSHLRAAQALRDLTLRNLNIQRDTLGVTRALRKAQDVTELDVARVQAQNAATEARLPQIRTQIYAAIYRLSVLTGQPPAALSELLMPEKPMLLLPDNLVVSSPVATIAQRPDVHAAERRLAQASALSNAAFADLFPKISLSAFFGTRRSEFFGALSPWSATADAMLPLLDFGRLRAQMHGADARQEQAFYLYKQAVLTALEDAEGTMNAYINERNRSELLHKVATEQARAVTIAREQYGAGIVTQLDLLDAERNQLDTESNWVLSLQAATDNLIGLYRALGEAPPPQSTTAAATPQG